MVQVLPVTGNIFGRIGKGLGQGLGEQIPKEIERQRLSAGLKRLGENKENLTPFQQAAEMASIPGGKELIPQVLPLIQQQQQARAFQERAAGKGTAPTTKQPSGQSAATEGLEPGEFPKMTQAGLATPREIARFKETSLKPPSQQDINQLADEFLSQGITFNPNEARLLAGQELQQNYQAQESRNSKLAQDLNNRMKLDLQSSGLGDFKDVAGEIQQSLMDQALYLVNAQGMSPEAASQKVSDIMTDLGKSNNKLREVGSWSNMFRSSKQKGSDLREQKKNFEKYGFGEQYNDVAAAQMGISRQLAANILDPIKNEKVKQEIAGMRASEKEKGIIASRKQADKDFDKVIKSIAPKDNILSIAYELQHKHRDADQFIQRIRELEGEGEIALTPRQRREIAAPLGTPFVGDILFKVF